MKNMKIVTIPESKKEELDFVICDLCKRPGDDETEWSRKRFEKSEVIISHEFGDDYPDSYSTQTITFHVCPDCFKNKVMKWFHENGATETISESEW